MSCIVCSDLQLHLYNGIISVSSRQIASFFMMRHVTICKSIESIDEKNSELFKAYFLTDLKNGKKYFWCYDVNEDGCLLLSHNLNADKEDKERFLQIIRITKEI